MTVTVLPNLYVLPTPPAGLRSHSQQLIKAKLSTHTYELPTDPKRNLGKTPDSEAPDASLGDPSISVEALDHKGLFPHVLSEMERVSSMVGEVLLGIVSLSELNIEETVRKLKREFEFDRDLSFRPNQNRANHVLSSGAKTGIEVKSKPYPEISRAETMVTWAVAKDKSWNQAENDALEMPKSFAAVNKASPPGQITRVFEIPSRINGSRCVNALGDYCAKLNFMNKDFAQTEGLRIDRTAKTTVTIGSGKSISTLGTTKASFQFQHEKQPYLLKFHVLPTCLHDVVLSKTFLRTTRTFANLSNKVRRVKERELKGIYQRHVLYLGSSAPTFTGRLKGIPQLALADSGAKIPVIDEEHAQKLNLKISRDDGDTHQLVFADGSTAHSSGMAYNVPWSFGPDGGQQHMLDFHVLPNAPAEVILSDTFLFDNEAFSRYECYLVDEEDDDPDAFFFAIDIDQDYASAKSSVSAGFAELVRQGEEADRIDRLPQSEQAAAWVIENTKREEWKTAQASSRIQSSSTSTATSNPQIQSQATSQKSKRSRLWLKMKRKSSK